MKILKNYGNFDQLFNEFKLKFNCFFWYLIDSVVVV